MNYNLFNLCFKDIFENGLLVKSWQYRFESGQKFQTSFKNRVVQW